MDSNAHNIGDRKSTINRQRAERRREMARTIKDMRGSIANLDPKRSNFEQERQHLFADTRLSAAYAVPMLALIVAAISILWVPYVMVGAWVLFAFATHFMMVAMCAAYERSSSEVRARKYWLNWFSLGDFLYGAAWSLFFLLPTQKPTNEGHLVFQFAAMLIVIAMNTMQSATLPRALLASTLPITLTVTFAFLQQASPIHYTLAAMAIGAQGFFLILGNQLIKNANTMLEYRAEKDHLIAELETANALSDESRRRAEAANMAKSRFLATMSHELRTPLNAILGFSEIMKDEVLGPIANANYKSYSADIHGSGQHLLNLINEILDLSRIEAGRHELHEEALLLGDVVEECIGMMQIRAKAKEITISEKHEGTLPKVWADERALRQVVLNLISNAVKFTPKGGDVKITVGWTSGGGQYVSVKDSGPGIPEEEIPVVMEAFGQGSLAIKSAEQGTGLGLSIVQALVAMHGGRFTLKSKLREGTDALFTLPKSRVMDYSEDQLEEAMRPKSKPEPSDEALSGSQDTKIVAGG
ncbi:two-component system cell cycle sensor histidine kinase PleC [Roseibium hamelinense]|uniref:histidine kinase n=1 Tax=Roseibium hamelinense TaxID=150831 RepID=A0A562T7D2_9HYPH|nr:HAMP domain-containing sensor histidine kinase [Roseibium hamelinense]MTI42058.1 HAMP domain-containing histidine kinase [Roseibium hamelinense]TWI89519.1 two-component system cell cycle sensor histidine kinase PleC [Roseibium hamelinense]